MNTVIVFLLMAIVVGLTRVYLDWSSLEKRIHRANAVNSKEVKETSIKIAATSAVTGLLMGLLGIIIRLSSPSNPSGQDIDSILYIAYGIICTISWSVFTLLIFGLKLIALKSVYKEKSSE